MTRLTHRGFVIAALAGCLALAAGALVLLGPEWVRPQHPAVTLTDAAYDGFRTRFNAAADSTRLLVLLSPT